MKVCLVYIAVVNGPITEDYIARFSATYHLYPPEYEHQTIVACNGGELPLSSRLQLSDLNPMFQERRNTPDWDIGAYLDIAHGPAANSDMMVCLGESVYFHREGWLKRIIDAWNKYGPGIYGFFSSNLVRAHLNTTAFCAETKLLKKYPRPIVDRSGRYEFEHGKNAFWRRASKVGKPVKLVTWDGEWGPTQWRAPANILWRGDQSNCLIFCNHSDRYHAASPETKIKWRRGADQPFK